jgi:hypothetical protein
MTLKNLGKAENSGGLRFDDVDMYYLLRKKPLLAGAWLSALAYEGSTEVLPVVA